MTSSRSLTTSKISSAIKSTRSEEHTSELQSLRHLVCRLLLEKKKVKSNPIDINGFLTITKDHQMDKYPLSLRVDISESPSQQAECLALRVLLHQEANVCW